MFVYIYLRDCDQAHTFHVGMLASYTLNKGTSLTFEGIEDNLLIEHKTYTQNSEMCIGCISKRKCKSCGISGKNNAKPLRWRAHST